MGEKNSKLYIRLRIGVLFWSFTEFNILLLKFS